VRARRANGLDLVFRQTEDDAVVEDAAVAAGALISAPLREAAARIIRAGELDPGLPAPLVDTAEPVGPAPMPPPNTHVVFTRPVRWLDGRGPPQQRPRGRYEVPQPVADAAIRLGVGVMAESDEGKTALARIHDEGFVSRPAHGLRPEPIKYVDLGSLDGGAVA
jgi:hypothetical protein